jgi:hypothetical protein
MACHNILSKCSDSGTYSQPWVYLVHAFQDNFPMKARNIEIMYNIDIFNTELRKYLPVEG